MTSTSSNDMALARPLCRAILAFVLTVAGGGAAAEVWVKVGENEKFRAYYDPASMRKEGNTVKMWDMFDYRTALSTPAGKKYLSVKRHTEYDCKQGRTRVYELSYHSENLSKGEVVAASAVNFDWSVVAKGSSDELLLDSACGK